MKNKKVEIYTSNTCPYCTLAKDYLKSLNVEFEEKNVQTNIKARMELMEKGYTGVPVILIDDVEIIGFDKNKINQLLSVD